MSNNELQEEFFTMTKIHHIENENNITHIKSGNCEIKINFYKEDIVRIWMEPKGEFQDPTEGKILAPNNFKAPEIVFKDEGNYYKLQSKKCVIRVYKNPLKFAMYDFRDVSPIWEEEAPLQYSEKCTKQSLKTKEDEYFYGGGVQNGYFSHKNKTICIENLITHWNDGAVSNPVPFYMSTAGYGAFRNTFKKGVYEFKQTAVTSHDENRFDCFYFYGPSLKQILKGYTQITGRPGFIPRWGLGLGDADCYNTSNTTYSGTHNKPNKVTTIDVLQVAQKYRDMDMPGGWILPNDGYGCGYNALDKVVKECYEKYGFRVGLWTENGVEKIQHEVGSLGSRLCKLDVAWVGPGYDFALNASKTAFEGIENSTTVKNSDGTYSERGYIWSVCGWAGTQRYSTVWTGDQSGNWEYIRFHIPTYIGSGLSGIPYIGSDVDGIFGGSAKTQVRDIQWKTFTPIMINMSGWADKDKQPWIWGEPYTSINRKYLKLRQRLTPYLYTYAEEAYETGMPMVRGMVLEFPKDNFAKTKNTQYQFMCGKWILVAPVYEDKETRDEIYLPEGKWIDYWTGKQYDGGKVINNYEAALDTLPVLIRAGAIIPMYPEALYDGQVQTDENNPLTIEVYPSGITAFELYEDDGHTTLYKQGKFCRTTIISEECNGEFVISVGSAIGNYNGMPFARKYEFKIHTTVAPDNVKFVCGEGTGSFNRADSIEEWKNTKCCCWYFNKEEKAGVLYIKTKAIPLHSEFKLCVDKVCSEIYKEIPKDINVPNVPSSFKITEIQDTKLKLQWNKAEGADYYEIKADGIIYSNLYDIFIHNELEFLSEHRYQIRAVNAIGESEWSEEISGTTLEDKMKGAVPFEELTAYSTSALGEKYYPEKAVDGEKSTEWISNYKHERLPQSIIIDMAKIYEVEKIVYTPRLENSKAVITKYNFYISEDGKRFEKAISEGTWIDDGEDKTIEIKPTKLKSVKLEALECSTPEFEGASVIQISIFKTHEAKGEVAADFTGDGKVDMADLNFALQYYGSKEGDNDWSYVSKADINRDGVIGIYDVAYTSSLIDPRSIYINENKASGTLKLKCEKIEVNANDEFTVDIIGEGITDLYAFESVIKLDKNIYELVSFEAAEISKLMISACKEKENKILVAYTNLGDTEGINGKGVLAKIKLRAKVNVKADINIESGIIIGSNFDVVSMQGSIISDSNKAGFEFQIPKAKLIAEASSEQAEEGDGSAGSVLDKNPATHWHTPWNKSALLPQSITVDLSKEYNVSKIKCKLRGVGAYGVITSYTIFSIDEKNNEAKISEGKWIDDGKIKCVIFENPISARKIKIQANEGNGGFATMVDLNIYAVI
jgi:alpha-glucosidase (family GH31 glycosyl hydrolase)